MPPMPRFRTHPAGLPSAPAATAPETRSGVRNVVTPIRRGRQRAQKKSVEVLERESDQALAKTWAEVKRLRRAGIHNVADCAVLFDLYDQYQHAVERLVDAEMGDDAG